MRIAVRVTPRGGRDAVEGWSADAQGRPLLKVRVAAAAADGQANLALIALIARTFGVGKAAVRLTGGRTARTKQLEVEGIDAADLAALPRAAS